MLFAQRFFFCTHDTLVTRNIPTKKLKQNSGWWCIFLARKIPAEFIGEEDVGVDLRSYLCRNIML